MYIATVATVQLTQTYPPYSPVCPGDRLVLTCVIGDTGAYWQPNSDNNLIPVMNSTVQLLGTFSLYTLINSTTTVITATNESVPLSANGMTIGCSDLTFVTLESYTINISNMPG